MGIEKVAVPSTKAIISLKRGKVERKLLLVIHKGSIGAKMYNLE